MMRFKIELFSKHSNPLFDDKSFGHIPGPKTHLKKKKENETQTEKLLISVGRHNANALHLIFVSPLGQLDLRTRG